MSFKNDFTWGVATASYQIEGATQTDGRGQSVWDMLCEKPGAVLEGHNGDVACDHYNRYPEDVALMADLGVNAYRLSIAWPRIMPEGTGAVNEKGLAFYDKLIDSLLEKGIDPWVTLFHWDLPVALYHKGGWMNPDMPKFFADYTRVVVDKLGDRVRNWMTLNEPQCFLLLGLSDGRHAPGDKLRWDEILLASHHSLIAHGLATQVIRAHSKVPNKVGMAPVGATSMPATNSPEDIAAAKKKIFSITENNLWNITWWMDPVIFGTYPEEGLKLFGKKMPKFTDAEMAIIKQPIDFFGQNTYQGDYIKAGENGEPVKVPTPAGHPMTFIKWPVTPDCLYWGPKFFHERYGLPIIVTENGLSNQDWVSLDGKCHDPQRIDYLHRHLRELKKAAADGVPIDGYFQWSFMDNFEWAEGYRERFGLVHVDYQTLKRTPKDSFDWYKQVIKSNGADL
jgi:beta-glucosidase